MILSAFFQMFISFFELPFFSWFGGLALLFASYACALYLFRGHR